jgi:hypothetical protein
MPPTPTHQPRPFKPPQTTPTAIGQAPTPPDHPTNDHPSQTPPLIDHPKPTTPHRTMTEITVEVHLPGKPETHLGREIRIGTWQTAGITTSRTVPDATTLVRIAAEAIADHLENDKGEGRR